MIEYLARRMASKALEGNNGPNGTKQSPEARTGMDGEDGGACRLSESRSLVDSRNWRPDL